MPSYVALVSGDSNEPVCRGHRILSREYFLRDKYLKMERSSSPTFQKFSIVDGDVLIETAEVFDVSVNIFDNLTLDKELLRALMSHSGEM